MRTLLQPGDNVVGAPSLGSVITMYAMHIVMAGTPTEPLRLVYSAGVSIATHSGPV